MRASLHSWALSMAAASLARWAALGVGLPPTRCGQGRGAPARSSLLGVPSSERVGLSATLYVRESASGRLARSLWSVLGLCVRPHDSGSSVSRTSSDTTLRAGRGERAVPAVAEHREEHDQNAGRSLARASMVADSPVDVAHPRRNWPRARGSAFEAWAGDAVRLTLCRERSSPPRARAPSGPSPRPGGTRYRRVQPNTRPPPAPWHAAARAMARQRGEMPAARR